MNFEFLKIKTKKQKIPSITKLRPKLFDTNVFWFLGLGASSIVFIVTAFIGAKLFYMQSSESFRESTNENNFDNVIDTNIIKNAVEKRETFINQKISIPRNPSI